MDEQFFKPGARALFSALALQWVIIGTATGQSYSITSSAIGSGGGTSSGGTFSVTGSIARHDAGTPSNGGAYTLGGGLFGQYMALQQTGAPPLTIRAAAGGNVQVVWASNVPGWILQKNTAELAPAGWVDVTAAPSVSGAEQYHQFSASGGRVFYRLRKL